MSHNALEKDATLIPHFGKTVSREEYSLLQSLPLEKKHCLVNELTGLLIESVQHDINVCLSIIELFECIGCIPSGATGQLKFLAIIEEAKRGDDWSRAWIDIWSNASFQLSKKKYEHPAIRNYRYSLDKKKPRQPNYALDKRNRQIAKIGSPE